MSTVKTIGKIFLAILILLLSVQIILTGFALLTLGAEKPEVMSYLVGRLVGATLFLILAVFGYRKLGA